MTILDYINYFKTAAINNKLLLHTDEEHHFYFVENQDFLNEISNGGKPPFMFLMIPDIATNDQLSDNVRDVFNGEVQILDYVADAADVADIAAKLESTMEIIQQIRQKMQNDRRRAQTFPNPSNILRHLDLNTIHFTKVMNVFDNNYGWSMTFQLNEPADMEFDEDEWNGEESYY